MGKYKYDFEVTYYTTGGFLKTKWFLAKNREDALKQLRQSGEKVIEVQCVRRAYTW